MDEILALIALRNELADAGGYYREILGMAESPWATRHWSRIQSLPEDEVGVMMLGRLVNAGVEMINETSSAGVLRGLAASAPSAAVRATARLFLTRHGG